MTFAIGAVIWAVGVALVVVGGRRLLRARRGDDLTWIARHPLQDQLLGGLTIFGWRALGFDRSGAIWSVVAGLIGIMLGIAVLVSR